MCAAEARNGGDENVQTKRKRNGTMCRPCISESQQKLIFYLGFRFSPEPSTALPCPPLSDTKQQSAATELSSKQRIRADQAALTGKLHPYAPHGRAKERRSRRRRR